MIQTKTNHVSIKREGGKINKNKTNPKNIATHFVPSEKSLGSTQATTNKAKRTKKCLKRPSLSTSELFGDYERRSARDKRRRRNRTNRTQNIRAQLLRTGNPVGTTGRTRVQDDNINHRNRIRNIGRADGRTPAP